MSARVDLEWTRPEDRVWADRLRLRLALAHGMTFDTVEEVVTEAHRACAESGEPAEELFGPAVGYAAEVAEDRVPVQVRAQADLHGATRRDQWMALAYAVGAPGLVLCLYVLLVEGWTTGVTPGGLVVVLAILTGMATATWGLLERHAGELRRGWALWAATAAVVVAGGWAGVTFSDREPLGTVSVLLPLVLCVGLLVLGARLPDRAVPEADPRELSVDAWFERLSGVLRGRYYLPRREVERHVTEARTYWHQSDAEHPHDEFGTPSVYALRLLQGSKRPHRGRRRVEAGVHAGLAVLWLAMLVGTLVEGGSGVDLAWRLGGLAFFTGLAIHGWRRIDDRPV